MAESYRGLTIRIGGDNAGDLTRLLHCLLTALCQFLS